MNPWQSPGQPAAGANPWQPPGQPTPPAGPQAAWQVPGGPTAPGQVAPGPPSLYGTRPPAPAWGVPQSGRPWTNFRPGIVPIRPLQLSDILDGAVKLVKFNPKGTLGLAIAVQLVVGLIAVGIVLLIGDPYAVLNDATASAGDIISGTLVSYAGQIPAMIAAALLPALLVYVTMQGVLGRRADVGQIWRATRGRLLPFLGAQLILGVILVGALFGLFALIGLSIQQDSLAGILSTIFLGFPALFVFLFWFSTKMLFVAPAIVVEGKGPVEGIGRSWQLTRGAFWRILGTWLLCGLIIAVAGSVIAFPLTAIFAAFNPDAALGGPSQGLAIVTILSQVVAGAITAPFQAAVACLLYVDQRIRKEGLDIDLINEVSRQP